MSINNWPKLNELYKCRNVEMKMHREIIFKKDFDAI